jgi:hypothetical protein
LVCNLLIIVLRYKANPYWIICRLYIDQYGHMCPNNNRNIFERRFAGEDRWNICEAASIVVPPRPKQVVRRWCKNT